MAKLEIIQFDPAKHQHLLPSIVALHVESIEHDDAPLRFLPPFTEEKRSKMGEFWRQRTQQTVDGLRVTVVALAGAADGDDGNNDSDSKKPKPRVVGIAELGLPSCETGPHRAELEMLIVSTSYRRRGLGKNLVLEIERLAVERKRTLLALSTTRNSIAEMYLYAQLGYTEFGRLPNYAVTPMTGVPADGVYFYKDLCAATGHGRDCSP
ncbi:hypothetical protein E4U41_003594 [Claviceps citrina]|nr:hypothetical protein E4U41_003594 [Claviceps citrina]